MEEKLKDIYENIKDRLSNPLIFSFIVSWLVYNWEITVALLWYDKDQIKAEGYKSIFEFIQYQLNSKCFSFIIPLILALVYTFIMPYIKEFVDFTNKVALLIGKKLKAQFLKDGLQLEISNLENKLKSVGDNSFLNGTWEYIEYDSLNKGTSKQIFINNGKWYFIIGDRRQDHFMITDFYFDPLSTSLVFTVNSKLKAGDISRFNLHFKDMKINELDGTKNDSVKVEFRKI